MGFFSKALGALGGGDKGTSSTGTFISGFAGLPQEIQNAYKGLGTETSNILKGGNLGQYSAPTPLSAGEQSAIDKLYKGFTPDANQLQSDISLQMNPFDQYVIDEINRQSEAGLSGISALASGAGQLGSNRTLLGMNDVDLSRLNQIGTFKQGQYNTALQNALTTLPQSRGQDAMAALTGGTYGRNIDMGTRMAPITTLQELAKAIGVLPSSTGQTQTGGTSGIREGNPLTSIGNLASIGATLFSDIRLKEDVVKVKGGELPEYEFNYKGSKTRYRGVMAQDVIKVKPEAVNMDDGFYTVDYAAIGKTMRIV